MNPLHRLRHPSPAKLFAIGFAGTLAISILSFLFSVFGEIAFDMVREDESLLNVGHLSLLVPLLLGLCAGLYALYARICRRKLNPLLVSIHFWISLAFACYVIYLSRDRLDLPAPGWQEFLRAKYETPARVFIIGRIMFGAAQIIFLMNLFWSFFFGREIQTDKS
jgi:cytochrome c oxidase subunit I